MIRPFRHHLLGMREIHRSGRLRGRVLHTARPVFESRPRSRTGRLNMPSPPINDNRANKLTHVPPQNVLRGKVGDSSHYQKKCFVCFVNHFFGSGIARISMDGVPRPSNTIQSSPIQYNTILTFMELLLKMPLQRVCCLPVLLTLREPSEEPGVGPSPAEPSSALFISFVTMPR